jgi:hypothetical protein
MLPYSLVLLRQFPWPRVNWQAKSLVKIPTGGFPGRSQVKRAEKIKARF